MARGPFSDYIEDLLAGVETQAGEAAAVFSALKRSVGIPDLSDEAALLISKMSAQPSFSRQSAIEDFISKAKQYGVWEKLGWLSVFGAHDDQAALLNWKTPTQSITLVNSPAFTIDRGLTGDGATSYGTTGIANNAFPNFSQNNGFMGAMILTDVSNNNMLDVGGGNNYINARNASNQFVSRAMFGSAVASAQAITAASSIGFSWWSRLSSTEYLMGKDANAPFAKMVGTEALNSTQIDVCRGGTNYSTRQIGMIAIGAALTEQEASDFYTHCVYPWFHDVVGAI